MPVNTNRWNRIRYTAFAPLYDRVASFHRQWRRSIELLDLRPGDRVLISGAGTGADLEHLPDGVRVVATDITPAMVQCIRDRARRLGREVDARVGDAQALDFPDDSFDAVILHLIVAVASDGRRVAHEAARVLRADGRVAIFDKFVSDQGVGLGRRLANAVTNALFSDVTRRLGPMVEGSGLRVVRREPAALGGCFEIVLLTKGGAADASA